MRIIYFLLNYLLKHYISTAALAYALHLQCHHH